MADKNIFNVLSETLGVVPEAFQRKVDFDNWKVLQELKAKEAERDYEAKSRHDKFMRDLANLKFEHQKKLIESQVKSQEALTGLRQAQTAGLQEGFQEGQQYTPLSPEGKKAYDLMNIMGLSPEEAFKKAMELTGKPKDKDSPRETVAKIFLRDVLSGGVMGAESPATLDSAAALMQGQPLPEYLDVGAERPVKMDMQMFLRGMQKKLGSGLLPKQQQTTAEPVFETFDQFLQWYNSPAGKKHPKRETAMENAKIKFGIKVGD